MDRHTAAHGTWACIAVALAVGCGGGSQAAEVGVGASAPPEPLPPLEVRQTKAYRGPDGLRVEVIDLAGDEALVRASGVDSELAGMVLRYKRVEDGRWYRYRTDYHGRSLSILVRQQLPSGEMRWKSYIPDASRDGFDIEYDEAASATVAVDELHRAHVEQQLSGAIEALARFDRAAEQAGEEQSIARDVAHTERECGKSVPLQVEWSTVTDEQLLSKSISGYCGSLLSGLRNLCRTETGKQFVKQSVKGGRCSLDGDAALSFQQGELRWSISFESVNLDQKARDALLAFQPAGVDSTLGAQILREKTSVCSDDKGEHVVLVGPRDAAHKGLAYGDGSKFFLVPSPPMLSDGWFFDPRQRDDKRNDNFRGLDLRVFSYVEPNTDKGVCKLVCGTRQTELKLLSGDKKESMLRGARYEPSPHGRQPYALARDKRGNYYYVDRGATEETAKDFRLYRGKRGRLKPLAMKDVVSDSEGEIFASESGRLRLLVGRENAQWIKKGRSQDLMLLPLADNWGLIYNELGVYLGKRLGVPCDDF